ncbi:unnamed protein product [Rotaria sp. Silwood1]|nr:unnamed protein product [Rotaria sp. Silwood1]
MYRTIQDNVQNVNNSENLNTTKIHRTLIEHGINIVANDRDYQNDPSIISSAIKTRTKQHENEQRELQELNMQFAIYLDHVQNLENYNGQLLAELDDLKENWDTEINQINETYGPDIKSLRKEIDNCLRDQILHELLLKKYEYDIWQIQQRINAFNDNTFSRLHAVQQELNQSINDLEQIKNYYDRYSADLIKERTHVDNLCNQLDGLTLELVNHRLERSMLENEIQTLREQAAFQDIVYQTQREELLSFGTPVFDVSKFYHTELIRAISDIRHDFETLTKSQINNLEEYYHKKMEQIQEIAQENERKRLIAMENETIEQTFNSESLKEIQNVYKELKLENNQLQIQFNDLLDDFTRIENENIREQQKLDEQLNQLQDKIVNKQANVSSILENNDSLHFELTTYRSLLNAEAQRIHRSKQEKQLQNSSPLFNYNNSDNFNRNPNNYTMQKISTQISATGSIQLDSIDFINDCIVIKYDKSTGKKQSLGNWIIRRQNDQQSEIIYRFPSSFVLKPGQRIRILSRRSPQSTRSDSDVLFADQINTWGLGQVMKTSLIDKHNEEKSSMTQTFLPR